MVVLGKVFVFGLVLCSMYIYLAVFVASSWVTMIASRAQHSKYSSNHSSSSIRTASTPLTHKHSFTSSYRANEPCTRRMEWILHTVTSYNVHVLICVQLHEWHTGSSNRDTRAWCVHSITLQNIILLEIAVVPLATASPIPYYRHSWTNRVVRMIVLDFFLHLSSAV